MLSDERMGPSFKIAAGPRQYSHSRVRVLLDSWSYFTVSYLRPLNLEGQVPVFISPRNRVARLYPQILDSLFVASYDSQGYGGDILTHLHIRSLHVLRSDTVFALYIPQGRRDIWVYKVHYRTFPLVNKMVMLYVAIMEYWCINNWQRIVIRVVCWPHNKLFTTRPTY
jgi:hypothetical protein